MTDTSAKAAQMQIEALRRMTPGKRLSVALGWSQTLRTLILQQVRQEKPEASEQEVRALFAIRWLGPELAAKVAAHAIKVHG
ncbi:hypothetical protein WJU23_13665 [Prosthecobacter sp. SYSU 5D2]|uniref:hypothetical protein n=1 Tax=Prosthecobacter sp. SYSU 5D2 TaxID=3134134 RepID=UPI0031FF1028